MACASSTVLFSFPHSSPSSTATAALCPSPVPSAGSSGGDCARFDLHFPRLAAHEAPVLGIVFHFHLEQPWKTKHLDSIRTPDSWRIHHLLPSRQPSLQPCRCRLNLSSSPSKLQAENNSPEGNVDGVEGGAEPEIVSEIPAAQGEDGYVFGYFYPASDGDGQE